MPKTSKTPRKPKQPGKPKKKSGQQRQAAHARAADLSAIHWIEDSHERRIACGRLQRQYIKPELLAKEAGLQQTKWIEYRYLSPLECTERFAQEYMVAYRRAYTRHFDPKVSRNKQPIASNFAHNTAAEMNSLWADRQLADELGMPYDLFLDVLMEGKIVGDKWRQPPYPINSYQDGKLEPGCVVAPPAMKSPNGCSGRTGIGGSLRNGR